jgi:hypothetical protein
VKTLLSLDKDPTLAAVAALKDEIAAFRQGQDSRNDINERHPPPTQHAETLNQDNAKLHREIEDLKSVIIPRMNRRPDKRTAHICLISL